MTTAAGEIRTWPRHRWWGVVLLLLVIQVGLVFWLGDRSLPIVRKAAMSPALILAQELPEELLTLSDPTLFAWANQHGFSGAAWLKLPPQNYRLADWTEPPRWLPLSVADLGNTFHRFVQTNLSSSFPIAVRPESRFTAAELPLPISSLATRSSLRVEGELAARHLLTQFDLPSQPHPDILTSSIVQVLVDAEGRTISATLLSGSGSREADQRALNLARTARFNSLLVSGPDRLAEGVAPLSWGQLIFGWHTTPMPVTNAPPANP